MRVPFHRFRDHDPAGVPHHSACAPGFTLIELLVVIAVIAVLIGVLLPALASARRAGRSSVCLSNLRQIAIICRQYADDHKGRGPAIGQPYGALPNWALLVQSASGRAGTSSGELYAPASVLACPEASAHYGMPMQRTYAMNATGHAGVIGPGTRSDPDNYDTLPGADTPAPAIRFDSITRPSDALLLADSAVDQSQALAPGSPPPTRTASVIDFRDPSHVQNRLGRFHPRQSFQWVNFDGSARRATKIDDLWLEPLP